MPLTRFEKIWSQHQIFERAGGQSLLHVERYRIHGGYGPKDLVTKAIR